MFHPTIYTQKTTAFQKNCGFSVPLFYKGFGLFSYIKSILLKSQFTVKYRTFSSTICPPICPPQKTASPVVIRGFELLVN